MRAGAISEIYKGTTLLARPMPMPPMIRDTMTPVNDGINAQPSADSKNSNAASNSGFFLPNRSLSSPDMATPMMQPTNAEDTNQPSWKADKANCFCNRGNIPDTTAISNPNKKPPSDATRVMIKR